MRLWLAALVLMCGLSAGAAADNRIALVVGNAAYVNAPPLANPLNDARDMAVGLKQSGFVVVEALDTDKRGLDAALRRFTGLLSKADVALFFYAGHGLQVGAQNYLVPIDAKLGSERDLDFEAVKLDFVLRQMEIDREGKTSIVILDACRDNPLSRNLARSMGTRSAAIGRGLAAASTGLGTFIAYSTQPGNVALDGDGRNSPFTAAMVRHMSVQGRNLQATMIEVRKDVVATTGGKQVPWDHSAMTADFHFVPGAAPSAPMTAGDAAAPAQVAALQERLRKLEDDAKSRELGPVKTTPTGAGVPTIVAKVIVPKESPNFDVIDNVGLRGVEIRSFRSPSPVACREACERDSACIGYQHGRKIPVMGTCALFSKIDERHEDASWRSGLRKPAEGAGLVFPNPISRANQGFNYYEGVSFDGDEIKHTVADSADGCMVVCRNTTQCVAGWFDSGNRRCTVYSSVKQPRLNSIPGTSAVVRLPVYGR